jgi:hypothetical protein
MNIWKISIFSGTGENRSKQSIIEGFVRTDNIRQASMFAHEAINETVQSATIEIETISDSSDLEMLDPYTVKWTS